VWPKGTFCSPKSFCKTVGAVSIVKGTASFLPSLIKRWRTVRVHYHQGSVSEDVLERITIVFIIDFEFFEYRIYSLVTT